jgi:nicotinamide riboside kinase
VEEYARIYLRDLGRAYRESDLEAILRGQLEAEDASPGLGRDPFLFCDTGPEVIWVWSFFKYGRVSSAIDEATRRRGYSGTILLDVDLPWTPDPLRENPSEEDRRELLGIYRRLLQEIGREYVLVGGRDGIRVENALKGLRRPQGES